jgi:hypothetical protein
MARLERATPVQRPAVNESRFYFSFNKTFRRIKMKELTPKKTYERPAVIHRELMESIAGTCDTTDPVNGKTGVGDTCTTTSS